MANRTKTKITMVAVVASDPAKRIYGITISSLIFLGGHVVADGIGVYKPSSSAIEVRLRFEVQ